jgi:hypothetical protein
MAAWRGGLAGVHARLDGGKKLSRPLKLGLVIRVLKAGECIPAIFMQATRRSELTV